MSILYFNTARLDDNALGKRARDFKEANPKEIQSEVLSHRVASLKSLARFPNALSSSLAVLK